MVGVIWFAQVAHYPLLGTIADAAFVNYQAQNMRKTGWVVGPLMIVEAIAAFLIVLYRPEGVLPVQAWLGLGLLIAIWVSTALLQVPLHNRLLLGFDDRALRRLVQTNWIRTVSWSARGAVVLWMLASVI
jgi:hypothetical protein